MRWGQFQHEHRAYHIFGPSKGPKRAKTGIFTIKGKCDHLFNRTMLEPGWNGIEDIQADQFGPFARPRISQLWPQGGQKMVKIGWNCLLATHFGLEGLFWVGRYETRLEHNSGQPGRPFWAFFPHQHRPYEPICVAKALFSVCLAKILAPLGHIWDILGLANEPNWSAWMSWVPFQPGSSPFSTNYGMEANLAYFIIFGPILASFLHFWSPWSNFSQFNQKKRPCCVPTMLHSL